MSVPLLLRVWSGGRLATRASTTLRRVSAGSNMPAVRVGHLADPRVRHLTRIRARARDDRVWGETLLLLLPPAERHGHVLVNQQPVLAALFQDRRVAPHDQLGAAGLFDQFASPRSRCPGLVAVTIHAQVVV